MSTVLRVGNPNYFYNAAIIGLPEFLLFFLPNLHFSASLIFLLLSKTGLAKGYRCGRSFSNNFSSADPGCSASVNVNHIQFLAALR